MDTIYLIEKLWLDPMENEITRAMGYEVIGYETDEGLAKQAVVAMGSKVGTGWPIRNNETVPVGRYKPVTRLKSPL